MSQMSLFPFFKKKKATYGLGSYHLPKNKRWLSECDYDHKLKEHDLLWLGLFNREFNEGAIKKGDGCALHYQDEKRKKAYRDNNRRSRDLFAIKQAGNILFELDPTLVGEDFVERDIDMGRFNFFEAFLYFQYCIYV